MMKIRATILFLAIIAAASGCDSRTGASPEALIPQPKEITVNSEKTIRLNGITEIIDSTSELPEEGYTITMKGRTAEINASDHQGIMRAKATLAQLAGLTPDRFADEDAFRNARVPDITVKDWPSFPLRGFMHDTGRNFREVETLKKEIDLMAFYKVNVFHWHLTDNPAWRIECRAYPQLNDPQYQRAGRDEGRFYTYEQIRDVIAYARERGVMVIPEIDMPGHSQYFDKTFGFPMASEEGMEVLKKCLKEFMEEIPSEDCPYIHIGSDEVYIADPQGFMQFCEGIVREGGRTPMAWYPGLPSDEGTISQIWSKAGRVAAGTDFPGRYVDSYMGYLNLGNPLVNTSYFFLHQLCGTEECNGNALGGILCLWNDTRVADKTRTFPHNGMPEGLLSFAESGWKGGKGYGHNNPYLLPEPGTQAHEALLSFEKKLSFHRDNFLKEWDVRWVANASLPWKVSISSEDGSELIAETPAWGGCIDLNALCRKNGITPGTERIEVSMTTEIYAQNDTTITAWVGFDSPARSNRMSDGIGEQGRWECSARVFSGDTEIFPAKPWNEPGAYRFHFPTWHKPANELPYTDEQFFWTREPAQIPLKAGWNTIRIECPRVFNAAIWVAAFVPVSQTADGRISEASGISYR